MTRTGERAKVTMDPRIRERRIKVRRDEGRRRLRLLVGLVAVALVIAGSVGASRSALLDVDHVRISGATKVTDAQVLAAAGLDRHRFMIDVDSGSAARRIAALPWVATAEVTRHWPGTVHIAVTERVAIAAISQPSGPVALVDSSGRVLDTAATPPPGLLRIDGFPGAPAPGRRVEGGPADAVAVAAALPDTVRSRVAAVTQQAGEIDLRLVGSSGIVRLGGTTDLDAKMVALATLLTRVDSRDLATIDVRVPEAPVLTRTTAQN